MTLGIGLYAPCMILVSLLGMDPKAAFPIMMGSCAFLMPVASARFIQAGTLQPASVAGHCVGRIAGRPDRRADREIAAVDGHALAGGGGSGLRGFHHAAFGPQLIRRSARRSRRSQAILNTESPWASIYDQAY